MSGAKEAALLIIDMQNDFVEEGAPLRVKGALGIVGNVKKVLDAFRKKGLPIFHIVRVHRKDASDVEITRKEKFLKNPFAVEGTVGARIIGGLEPLEGEYTVKKIRMSAFLNTDLDLMLKSLGVKNVVITGIQTPNCIRTSVFDAVAYNDNVYLVDDAVAAQNDEIHRANVLDMQNIGVKTVKTAEAGRFLTE